MLLASVLTLTAPFAFQAKPAPLYVPLVTRSEYPLEEMIHYRVRCQGFDVDVRYRVSRTTRPTGSSVSSIEANGVPVNDRSLSSLNAVLNDRFITGVTTYSCYVSSNEKATVNLWLEVDAVGSLKDDASHIILNITGDQMNLMFRQMNEEASAGRR